MQTDASVSMINTSLIIPNKYQPRKVFDESALNTLAESIKNYGIINPILVRKKEDKYEIIAGERRFRAAQIVGLTEVPVIIKNADEQQMAELALIENLERQNLSPIEEAKSYEEIMRIGNQTQQSLSQKLGKSQAYIANKIRLLSLPQEIQDALANKQISERHARSLISVESKEKQLELLNRIITEKLTVKETEQIINSKEINDKEIKQAISDIMKSLNIKEEEKEDDNMNNGNFFPNFDNNNNINNNTSLNMMNMQSMNQPPVAPEPEMVMPTMNQPIVNDAPLFGPLPQPGTAPIESSITPPLQGMNAPILEPLTANPAVSPDLNNNNINQMGGFMVQQENLSQPTMEQPMVNDTPLFGPLPQPGPMEAELSTPMTDMPLFNPNVAMPTTEQPMSFSGMPERTPMTEPQLIVPNAFEVPVVNPQPESTPVTPDRLTELQNLLTTNGFTFKTYSNDTENCVIIELPRN